MAFFEEMGKLEKHAAPFALCTIINTVGSVPREKGTKMVVLKNRTIFGTIGGGELEAKAIDLAVTAMADSEPKLLKFSVGDDERGKKRIVEVFIDPVLPSHRIAVIGAGHVGQSIVHLAKWLKYYVILVDERPELCNPEIAPGADEYIVCKLHEVAAHPSTIKTTFFVLTTRNAEDDIACLPGILKVKPAYIGVIGSRSRWESTCQGLIKAGISQEVISRIHSPIGIEIGAKTPEEIAISVMAEITSELNPTPKRKVSEAK